jgi:hypothetical protein
MLLAKTSSVSAARLFRRVFPAHFSHPPPVIFPQPFLNNGIPADPNNTSIVVASSGAPVAGREVIDNSTHTYYVTTDFGVVGNTQLDELRFYGFRIRYTVSTLNP